MKRFALRFKEGYGKGKYIGETNFSPVKSPKLFRTPKEVEQALDTMILHHGLRDKLEMVTFWLVERDQLPYTVNIIESERGWGSKIDEVIHFPTAEEADQYVKDYNTKYNPPVKSLNDVPDWYMKASRGK